MSIPRAPYETVRQRAQLRCEYCHYPELLSSAPLSTDALRIIGKTPTGRATCNRLDLNDERREEPFIQNARRQWIAGGLHPPNNDPQC